MVDTASLTILPKTQYLYNIDTNFIVYQTSGPIVLSWKECFQSTFYHTEDHDSILLFEANKTILLARASYVGHSLKISPDLLSVKVGS